MGMFSKQGSEAEIAKLKPEDMNAYEESLKTYRDNCGVLKTIREEGLELGLIKGRQEGRNKGCAEGVELGKREIAKKMMLKGTEVSVICEFTGLTAEQIEKLKSKTQHFRLW